MNKNAVRLILRNYIDKFEHISERESYKWVAFKHFQDHWDLEAAEFLPMLKEALRRRGNLVDSKPQPTAGIIKLSEEEPEAVRSLFRQLLSDDGGDLAARLNRIDGFVGRAQELLGKHKLATWRYEQSRRSAMFYLSLGHPDDNFLFKYKEAKQFADHVEFGESIGSGQHFSLASYYRMCEELLGEVERLPEFKALHLGRLDDSMYADPECHILAYDITYCSSGYHLDSGIALHKSAKKHSKAKSAPPTTPNVDDEIAAVNAQLLENRRKEQEFVHPDLIGMEVIHKKWGVGVIIARAGLQIEADFAARKASFLLPGAIRQNYLAINDPVVKEKYEQLAEILRNVHSTQERLKKLQAKSGK